MDELKERIAKTEAATHLALERREAAKTHVARDRFNYVAIEFQRELDSLKSELWRMQK